MRSAHAPRTGGTLHHIPGTAWKERISLIRLGRGGKSGDKDPTEYGETASLIHSG
jgi:hypothetical protein